MSWVLSVETKKPQCKYVYKISMSWVLSVETKKPGGGGGGGGGGGRGRNGVGGD